MERDQNVRDRNEQVMMLTWSKGQYYRIMMNF